MGDDQSSPISASAAAYCSSAGIFPEGALPLPSVRPGMNLVLVAGQRALPSERPSLL